MTDPSSDRIRRLLAGADECVATADGDAPEAEDDLHELADEAHELVSTSHPAELLAALGADGSEGDEPGSIPEALRTSSPETVVALRKLLTLSRLSEWWGEEGSGEFRDELEELGRLSAGPAGGTGGPEARGTDGPGAEGADEGTPDAEGEDGRDVDGSEDPDRSEEFKSQFAEVVTEIRERLQDEGEAGSDEEGSDEAEAEPAESGSDEGEGGRGEGGRGRRRSGSVASRRGTTFSTMPRSGRPDLEGVPRLSTVPERRG